MRSKASVGIDASKLMLIVHCELVVSEGSAAGVSFPRAIVVTRPEAVGLMKTGLAGLEDPEKSIKRWHKSGLALYHNFLRRPDGSLAMESMSGAEMMVGDSVKEEIYADSLVAVMAPLMALGARGATRRAAELEFFSDEATGEARSLLEKLQGRREPPAAGPADSPAQKPN